MRICKLIDTKNGFEWLSLSYIIKEIENNFSCYTCHVSGWFLFLDFLYYNPNQNPNPDPNPEPNLNFNPNPNLKPSPNPNLTLILTLILLPKI